MTIPSLGGSGKPNFKPISDALPKPMNVDLPSTEINLAPNEGDIHLQDMPKPIEPTEPNKPTDATSGQMEPTQSFGNDTASPNEEYSIKDFKRDYQKLLYEKVMPVLATFEGERKKKYIIALASASVLGILAFLVFFFVNSDQSGKIVGALITGAVAIWVAIKKNFEKKVKIQIMPILMQSFHNFNWLQSSLISEAAISSAMIIPREKKSAKRFDDCFAGKYRDVEILLSECEYWYGSGNSRKNTFSGIIIRLQMNKNFEGLTVVRPKKGVDVRDCSDLKKAGLTEVKLEDVEFGKKYEIYSTDQVEARYLLTTSFMERFKNIALAFKSDVAFCSFVDEYVYIAPYTKKDLFDLCSLTKPVTDSKQFDVMFDEIVSILELVDHFKLDKKLGL